MFLLTIYKKSPLQYCVFVVLGNLLIRSCIDVNPIFFFLSSNLNALIYTSIV